jgi:beta-barrel assembly-enhancing protease
MKTWILVAILAAVASPAHAQLGGILNKAQRVQEAKQKFDDLNITEAEELKIGQDVSLKVRQRFGVVQDPAVHKYVTLVGTALAQQTDRPNLPWTFIVLDTDGVNAFAAPGGIVHITRGALGLIRNESELAGVLAHEITHVAHKHTVNAIRKSKAVQLGTNETLSNRGPFLDKIANKAYEMVLEGTFDRGDELDADEGGVALAQKLGYAPAALGDFLARLDDRNKDQPARNGLFASHPETKERIDKIRKAAGANTGAVVAARYIGNVHYQPTEITKIAVVTEGTAGLAGSTSDTSDKNAKKGDKPAKEEPPQKKGFGLGSLKQTVAPEKNTAQVSASGGARGLGPDRLAKGGSNPAVVKTTVSAAEVAAFKKGIA